MATVTAGSGATINATTIEGQLWQICHYINIAERGLSEQRLTLSKSDDYILNCDFRMSGVVNFNAATGVFSESVSPYLSTLSFVGGGGTIKASTLAQYFIDVVNYIILWQNTPSKNPNNLQNVTSSFNFNSLEYSGSIILPYVSALAPSGAVTETATEWLLT